MRHVTLAARRAQQYLRRPPQPRWLPPPTRIAAVLLGFGLAVALTSWVMAGGFHYALSGVSQRLLAWSGQSGLAVRKVMVEGRRWTPPETLRSQLNINLGTPLLAIDTAAVRDRLETLAWVERATVARLLPDAVQIRLLERQPLALWQRAGRFEVIDRAGEVIEGALLDHHPDEYGHLRVLVGDGAPQEAAALFALLSTEPALSSRVVAATRVGERRWNVHFDHDVEVWLPERDVLGAWQVLADKARDEALLERAVTVIDLRFLPERLRLRLDPAALADGGT
jgi:cell division protein FtsQ